MQPDEETARALDEASGEDADFRTVGELWADEADVKEGMARKKGGRRTGQKRRAQRKVVRRPRPLVTWEEDERAADAARRQIAEEAA